MYVIAPEHNQFIVTYTYLASLPCCRHVYVFIPSSDKSDMSNIAIRAIKHFLEQLHCCIILDSVAISKRYTWTLVLLTTIIARVSNKLFAF
jgi:hypothetical protein